MKKYLLLPLMIGCLFSSQMTEEQFIESQRIYPAGVSSNFDKYNTYEGQNRWATPTYELERSNDLDKILLHRFLLEALQDDHNQTLSSSNAICAFVAESTEKYVAKYADIICKYNRIMGSKEEYAYNPYDPAWFDFGNMFYNRLAADLLLDKLDLESFKQMLFLQDLQKEATKNKTLSEHILQLEKDKADLKRYTHELIEELNKWEVAPTTIKTDANIN